MRIDRLFAIAVYLLNRGTVSASALAERFEVSKRTIQRDIDALNEAGIPIVSTYGAEGGYAIIDGFKLLKQNVGIDDYLHIITALKGLGTAYGYNKVSATLDKVLASIPSKADGGQRVFVDLAVAREGVNTDALLRAIEDAVVQRTPLRIEYVSAESVTSTRVVEPLALSFQWYAWYLFAYCRERQDYRLFKLPRIVCCEATDGVFSKEHGDVERLMSDMYPDKRPIIHMRLLCKGAVRRQVMEYLAGSVTEERLGGDFVYTLALPFERMWFSLLMGFGDKVQVLEPEDIKDMLREKAAEILNLYRK